MGRYVAINKSIGDIRLMKCRRLVPSRRHKKGPRPGIHGQEARHAGVNEEESQWVWMRDYIESMDWEVKELMAECLEIGIKACWYNHLYQFAGKNYKQKDGGPIGERVVMACSRIVMIDWGAEVRDRFERSEKLMKLESVYADDDRHVIEIFKEGDRWNEDSKKFEN